MITSMAPRKVRNYYGLPVPAHCTWCDLTVSHSRVLYTSSLEKRPFAEHYIPPPPQRPHVQGSQTITVRKVPIVQAEASRPAGSRLTEAVKAMLDTAALLVDCSIRISDIDELERKGVVTSAVQSAPYAHMIDICQSGSRATS